MTHRASICPNMKHKVPGKRKPRGKTLVGNPFEDQAMTLKEYRAFLRMLDQPPRPGLLALMRRPKRWV